MRSRRSQSAVDRRLRSLSVAVLVSVLVPRAGGRLHLQRLVLERLQCRPVELDLDSRRRRCGNPWSRVQPPPRRPERRDSGRTPRPTRGACAGARFSELSGSQRPRSRAAIAAAPNWCTTAHPRNCTRVSGLLGDAHDPNLSPKPVRSLGAGWGVAGSSALGHRGSAIGHRPRCAASTRSARRTSSACSVSSKS